MSLLQDYQGLICDLDGVVYRGAGAVPHAIDALTHRPEGTGLVFATNNASRPSSEVAAHLTRLGLQVGARQVVTSAEAGAAHLARLVAPGVSVLAVGGPGVREALVMVGLQPVRRAEEGVVAVLQGYGRDVTAGDLAEASCAVRAGAIWVATNRDLTLPTDRGPAPGNGTLVEAVVTATGRQPVVVGKPEAPLYELSVSRLGLTPRDVLAVGDRLDTDILGAMRAGLDSLWVLTGVDDLLSLVRSPHDLAPTHVGFDLRVLSAPAREVSESDGWWICGSTRVRVDLDPAADDLVSVSEEVGVDRGTSRPDLLSAGSRALLALRDVAATDRDRLEMAAHDLTSRLA